MTAFFQCPKTGDECEFREKCSGTTCHLFATAPKIPVLEGGVSPRKDADAAFAAFMAMPPSEWLGLIASFAQGGVLEPEERKGFDRACAVREKIGFLGGGVGWPFSTPAPQLVKFVEADVSKIEARLDAEFRAFAAKHPELSLDECARLYIAGRASRGLGDQATAMLSPPYAEKSAEKPAPAATRSSRWDAWVVSANGDEFSSDEYDSREAAIAAVCGVDAALDLGHGEPFCVGRKTNPLKVLPDASALIDQMTDDAYALAGEHAEEWISDVRALAFGTKEERRIDELDAQLKELITAWLKKHHLEPRWFGVEDVTNHQVPEASEEELQTCLCLDCQVRRELEKKP